MSKAGEHERSYQFVFSGFEKWALPRLAAAMPSWVMPDHLTVIGIISATAICAAYLATNVNPNWFWAASALLVLQWFGDSLDGSLARFRKTERPRYGYYLDHMTDAYSSIVIVIGLGLSSVMAFYVGVALVVVYLVMSINVYLETHIDATFRMGYGRLGPTEARVILIALNTVAVFAGPIRFAPLGNGATVFDLAGLIAAAAMGLMLLVRAASNLKRLGALEPPGVRRDT